MLKRLGSMLSRLKRRLFTAVFEMKTISSRDLEGRKIISKDSIHLTSGRAKEKELNVDSLSLSLSARFNHRDSIRSRRDDRSIGRSREK